MRYLALALAALVCLMLPCLDACTNQPAMAPTRASAVAVSPSDAGPPTEVGPEVGPEAASKPFLIATVPGEHDIKLMGWPDGHFVTDPGGNDRPCDEGCLVRGNDRFGRAHQDAMRAAGLLLSDGGLRDGGREAGPPALDKRVFNEILTKSLEWTQACMEKTCSTSRDVTFPP